MMTAVRCIMSTWPAEEEKKNKTKNRDIEVHKVSHPITHGYIHTNVLHADLP